jgi:hypothetical protein
LIAVVELLSTVIILMTYGHLLHGFVVDVASDALGACEWANKRRSSRPEVNDLFKLIGAASHSLDVVLAQRWLTRWRNYRSDRGASLPIEEARAILDMGLAAEITLAGLPCDFLRPMADAYYPSLQFNTAAWAIVNKRE